MPRRRLVRRVESMLDETTAIEEAIRKRAYEPCQEGGEWGRATEHWFVAEREVIWKPAAELSEQEDGPNPQAAPEPSRRPTRHGRRCSVTPNSTSSRLTRTTCSSMP